jgi:hypothetical protein
MRAVANRSSARAALAWAACGFVALQLGFAVLADGWMPELYDEEFGARLALLGRRRAEHPDRPLLVVVGSSRTAHAFRPERLPPLVAAGGREVLPFNFSHVGAGPVYNLLTVRRLLAGPDRPGWVVQEVMPPFVTEEWARTYTRAAVAGELPALHPYAAPGLLYPDFLTSRLLPWHRQRHAFLWRVAPGWVGPTTALRHSLVFDRLGGEVARMIPAVTPEDAARAWAGAEAVFGPGAREFRVSPQAQRALREALGECRRHGVRAALLLAPESPAFQRLYTPDGRRRLEEFCRGLAAESGATLIDARDWLPEAEFTDGHHVLLSGQADFTDRFGREVLAPWVAQP